jgi:hypothetical protein
MNIFSYIVLFVKECCIAITIAIILIILYFQIFILQLSLKIPTAAREVSPN